MKKLIALVLALVMILVVAAASAVTIEITRDDSYAGETGTAGNSYTAYKVFSATYSSNTSSGGNANADGTPGNVTGNATAVSYTASAAVAAKLVEWVAAVGTEGQDGYVAAHWARKSGNEWFNLTPIAGTDTFSVTWAKTTTTSAEAQDAAQWLLENSVYEGTGTDLDFANGKWSKSGLEAGYYIVKGGIGTNLIAATTDVQVIEKNDYPPLDKTQADEDNTTQSNADRDVAVGDVLNYEVKVTIPATAKVGDRILVWDKKSAGLTYVDGSVAVKQGSNIGNATISDPAAADVDSSWTWSKLITVTDGSQGSDVVFAFSMTVNSGALVDSGKVNESGLKYGNESAWKYNSIPDRVVFKTYYAGIHKYDGNTNENLQGVTFTLKEGTADFNVTLGADGVYVQGGNSNEVVTDANGMIYIRGLDEDKTYTLHETGPLTGYNPLAEDVTLTKHLDSVTVTDESGTTTTTYSFDKTKAVTDTTWGQVPNNKGTLLPSTGGIGTTIFYILGGLLVVGAAVILVARRKASN